MTKFYGNQMRTLRLQAGLSQSAVAKALKFTNGQYISNWERGLCAAPVKSLRKISRLYKVDLNYIVDLYSNEHDKLLKERVGIK